MKVRVSKTPQDRGLALLDNNVTYMGSIYRFDATRAADTLHKQLLHTGFL